MILVPGRTRPLPAGITFKAADRFDELTAAFSLLHDAYVGQGYMEPHPSGLRITRFHLLPLTTTFVGQVGEQVAVTLNLVPDDAFGLPMDEVYGREMDRLRAQGRRLAEVGALACLPAFRSGHPAIPMLGNKTVHTYARHHLGMDDLVIAVNPKHLWFYGTLLLFEQIGDATTYPYVNDAPVVGMHLDLHTAEARYRDAYAGVPRERDLHHFFFSQTSDAIRLPADGGIVDMEALGLSERIHLLYNACHFPAEDISEIIP